MDFRDVVQGVILDQYGILAENMITHLLFNLHKLPEIAPEVQYIYECVMHILVYLWIQRHSFSKAARHKAGATEALTRNTEAEAWLPPPLLDLSVWFGIQLPSQCINDSVVMHLVIDERKLAFLFRSCMDKLKETFIHKELTDSIFPTLFTEDICVLIRAFYLKVIFFFPLPENCHSEFLTKCSLSTKHAIKTHVQFQG